ncbi:hypothetical protein JCGZ_09316 [Jatropha curcas]|uniref:Uncharacterized protein n=1 Tax=Jatropha curcas TaxID=180498 RepID=A0A067KJ24_JATCU|nr:small cysteine and glycine repeat-containing protein 2 [Jatropha curcas]KDP35028.1 hypothetical protein JCGZ_09316 [Jatropha curcas]
MVREWREAISGYGREGGDGGRIGSHEALLLWWAALITLSIITAIIFSCAGGATEGKGSNTHGSTGGTGCGAGCGGGCGG